MVLKGHIERWRFDFLAVSRCAGKKYIEIISFTIVIAVCLVAVWQGSIWAWNLQDTMGALHSPDRFQSAHLVVQVDHSHFCGSDHHPISGGDVQGFYKPIYLERRISEMDSFYPLLMFFFLFLGL